MKKPEIVPKSPLRIGKPNCRFWEFSVVTKQIHSRSPFFAFGSMVRSRMEIFHFPMESGRFQRQVAQNLTESHQIFLVQPLLTHRLDIRLLLSWPPMSPPRAKRPADGPKKAETKI